MVNRLVLEKKSYFVSQVVGILFIFPPFSEAKEKAIRKQEGTKIIIYSVLDNQEEPRSFKSIYSFYLFIY